MWFDYIRLREQEGGSVLESTPHLRILGTLWSGKGDILKGLPRIATVTPRAMNPHDSDIGSFRVNVNLLLEKEARRSLPSEMLTSSRMANLLHCKLQA
jgi:hypothetical protein